MISKVLQHLLADDAIKTTELARELSIPRSSLQRIVSGKTKNPNKKILNALAKHFNLTINQLRGLDPIPWLERSEIFKSESYPSNFTSVPLLTWEHLNDKNILKTLIKKQETIFQYITTEISVSETAYALKINDDSMIPVFNIGTIIIVDPKVEPQNGSYAIIRIHKINKITLRQVIIDAGQHFLKPLHPNLKKFSWLLLENNDEYLGCVVQAKINFPS